MVKTRYFTNSRGSCVNIVYNFFVTLLSCSYITMLPGVENLSGIRTFRVLRALRTISAVKGKEMYTLLRIFATQTAKKRKYARIVPINLIG